MLKQITALAALPGAAQPDVLGPASAGTSSASCSRTAPTIRRAQIAEEMRRTVAGVPLLAACASRSSRWGSRSAWCRSTATAAISPTLMRRRRCRLLRGPRTAGRKPGARVRAGRHAGRRAATGEMQWIPPHPPARSRTSASASSNQLIQPLGGEGEPAPTSSCEVLHPQLLDTNGKIIEPLGLHRRGGGATHLIGSPRPLGGEDRPSLRPLAEAQLREWSRPVLFRHQSLRPVARRKRASRTSSSRSWSGAGSTPGASASRSPRRRRSASLDSAIRFISGPPRTRGAAFILDDFGSGLSSFAYLARPSRWTFLKIDGEFVQNMMEDPGSRRAMVESINQIGHVMGLADDRRMGGEPPEPSRALKELGVDYAQGYWLCRPQPLVHGRVAVPHSPQPPLLSRPSTQPPGRRGGSRHSFS